MSRSSAGTGAANGTLAAVSVIVPTYNEAAAIERLLVDLLALRPREIIAADGGSTDGTPALAARYPVRLLQSPRGRAAQMNAGAAQATGEVLLFLHADCRPAPGALQAAVDCIRAGCVGGCFTQRIASDRLVFRAIELTGNLRARWLRTFYGDQAIFVRRDVFRELGGFPAAELFEDIRFSRRLARAGPTRQLRDRVHTSARRWEKQGIMHTTLTNLFLSTGFLAGLPAGMLRRVYADVR